jgi:FdhE protein
VSLASYQALSGEIPPLRLPDPALLFEARARRLEALAAEAGAEPFLALLGRVARGQRDAARALRGAGAPAVRERVVAAEALPADGALLPALAPIVAAVRQGPLPAPADAALRGLADAGEPAVRRLADEVLSGQLGEAQRAAAPFVGAALQVVAALRAEAVDLSRGLGAPSPPGEAARVPTPPWPLARELGDPSPPGEAARVPTPPWPAAGCPVCGSPPVAGTIGGDDRLRYLTCGLCSAEWHVPRLHCATCGANEGLSYRHLEHEPGARAEACDRCKTYVKLFDLEKRPGAEPLADDAATLALDVLMGEEGYARGGVNLVAGI